MEIDFEQRCLGKVDVQALRDTILAQGAEAWEEQRDRQKIYEVHRDTESIVMLFCDESWPNGEISRYPGWDRLADTAVPVIDHVINTHYAPGGTLLRAMAAKLNAGGRIPPHRDTLVSFRLGHRIHVPITTNEAVRFIIKGKPYKFEVGQAYELNNQKKHSVINMGKDDRITFIFDYVPPEQSTSDINQ